ncbi:PIG-L family deacetylase [Wukongibacter baidiensis]|uniref:PIG-L family deacetylase n=1 Tax=Wukongibacter baidiensis TaxID=1723361 RepID=UPI003D7F9B5C
MIKNETSILVVLAHPDDEFATAGLLIRAHNRGLKTHLVCATRGEAGRINDFKNPSASEKKQIRTKELKQSCELLGITSLEFLELEDSKGNSWQVDNAINRLSSIFNEKNPDMVITFDRNGGNGHPDHKAISNITAKTFKRLYTDQDKKLYHLTLHPRSIIDEELEKFTFPEEFKRKILKCFSIADDKVTSLVKLGEEELYIKLKLLEIYKSQFPDTNGNYYKMPLEVIRKIAVFESYTLVE